VGIQVEAGILQVGVAFGSLVEGLLVEGKASLGLEMEVLLVHLEMEALVAYLVLLVVESFPAVTLQVVVKAYLG
jgi:hypothetical protein